MKIYATQILPLKTAVRLQELGFGPAYTTVGSLLTDNRKLSARRSTATFSTQTIFHADFVVKSVDSQPNVLFHFVHCH